MITLYINGELVGQCQYYEHTIQREPMPMYVTGNVDPRNFARGRRGIALSFTNVVFGKVVDLSFLIEHLKVIQETKHCIHEVSYQGVDILIYEQNGIAAVARSILIAEAIPKTNRYASAFHLKDD